MNTRTLFKQEGGQHYKNLVIQPTEYIHANKLEFIEGNVIKYITRWRDKGGFADLRKIIHYCEMLMELETVRVEREYDKLSDPAKSPETEVVIQKWLDKDIDDAQMSVELKAIRDVVSESHRKLTQEYGYVNT